MTPEQILIEALERLRDDISIDSNGCDCPELAKEALSRYQKEKREWPSESQSEKAMYKETDDFGLDDYPLQAEAFQDGWRQGVAWVKERMATT